MKPEEISRALELVIEAAKASITFKAFLGALIALTLILGIRWVYGLVVEYLSIQTEAARIKEKLEELKTEFNETQSEINSKLGSIETEVKSLEKENHNLRIQVLEKQGEVLELKSKLYKREGNDQ